MRKLYVFIALLLLAGGMVGFGLNHGAEAGPEIVGNPDGSNFRAIVDNDGYKQIVYVAAGAKTMSTTPTTSGSTICGLGSQELFTAHVQLVGTMAGTAPTLSVQWQQSFDNGTTWVNLGTAMTVNATVTPADQSQTAADVYGATTAVALADCFRVQYTFGGTGTVTANFQVVGSAQ